MKSLGLLATGLAILASLGFGLCLTAPHNVAAQDAPPIGVAPRLRAEIVGMDAPPKENNDITVEWTVETDDKVETKSIKWAGGTTMDLPSLGEAPILKSPTWNFSQVEAKRIEANTFLITYAAWKEAKPTFKAVAADGSAIDFSKRGESLVRLWPLSPSAGLAEGRLKIERFNDTTSNSLTVSSGKYAVRACISQESGTYFAHQEVVIKAGESEVQIKLSEAMKWVECSIDDQTKHCAGSGVVFVNCPPRFIDMTNSMRTARRVAQSEARASGDPARMSELRMFGFFVQNGEFVETSKQGGKAWFPNVAVGDWYAISPDQLGIYRAEVDLKASKVTIKPLAESMSVTVTVAAPQEGAPAWQGLEISESVDLSKGGRSVERLLPKLPEVKEGEVAWPRVVTIRSLPVCRVQIGLAVGKDEQAPRREGYMNATSIRGEAGKTHTITLPMEIPRK